MDQMKQIVGNIKKYHFWILCAIVVLLGLTSWYLSTSKLKSEADKNAADIKSKETEVNNVLKIEPHPNTDFLTGMDKMIGDYSNNLAKGWQYRYNQQKDLLVWPDRLGPDFRKQVNRLRPIEEFVSFDDKGYIASQEIPAEYLDIYRNFITLELPTLAEKIGSKWSARVGEARASSGMAGSKMGMGGMGGSKGGGPPKGYGGVGGSGRYGGSGGSKLGTEDEEIDHSVVFWNAANQQEILDEHFKFASEEATPHTLDVLYAQEDLWVLDAIVEVIKRTNGDADANYNAAVKEIESIQMGRTVSGMVGQITMLDQSVGGGMGGGMGSMAGMAGGMGAMQSGGAGAAGGGGAAPTAGGASGGSAGGGPPPGAMGGAPPAPGMGGPPPGAMGGMSMSGAVLIDPAIGRYVDIDYNPLDPKILRSARTSEDAKDAIYSVAKRMPVRLRMRIDQRKLNDLLAECGNSSLPIEVRQVRINCDAGTNGQFGGASGGSYGSGGSSGSSSMGGGPPPTGGSKGMSGSKGGGRPGQGMRSGSQSMDDMKADSNDIVVEVYGIVHIYNPLNQKQLNTNLREDDGVVPAAPESPTAAASASSPQRS